MSNRTSTEKSWEEALGWFRNQPMGRRKVELSSIIRPIYESLKQAPDVESLHQLYVDPREVESALQIARNAYPENERLWNLSRTRDVAYGMRLAELRGEDAPRE